MSNSAKTKFNVDKDKDKRTYDGIIFDSVLEMRYYRDYILPKMGSGEITKCELQVPYSLQEKFKHVDSNGKSVTVRAIEYVADFVITWSNGHIQVVDTKGMPDSVAKIKRKMFWYRYPDIDYIWVAYSKRDGGWIEYNELKKCRSARKKSKAASAARGE